MDMNLNEIIVNGEKYIKASQVNQPPVQLDGKTYCIVRTYSAGVFAGYIDRKSVKDQCATIFNSRRIWYWEGAASLSQLATDGTSNPSGCKFPCEVVETDLANIIEVIVCTEKAKDSISEVPVWQK